MSDSPICTPWATPEELPCDLEASLPEGVEAPSRETIERWIMYASEVLFDLSGSVWRGVCEATVRPCCEPMPARPARSWWPGEHGSVRACSCRAIGKCGTHRAGAVDLGRNVVEVLRVVVDGVELDPSAYALVEGRWLVSVAGHPGWPCCQDLTIPDGEAGSWSVEFRFGAEPPAAGKMAAAALACEFVKASVGAPCQLPKRVTSVSRQGVSQTVGIDPFALFGEGATGVDVADLWLASVRRGIERRPGRVFPPGFSRR